jgi:hypothetical protein
MRVALSGSAGTGKTTLGQRLALDLELPYLEEGMRRRLEAGLDVHALGPGGMTALLEELWAEQRGAEAAASAGFVADRSSLDFAAFWLHYGLCHDEAGTERWMRAMREHVASYDRVVLLPWGVFSLVHDGVRSTNPWVQLRVQCILEGLLERFVPGGRLLRVPPLESLEQRLVYLRHHL